MIIPWQSLNTDILDAMLEEIVTRDGTDYGDVEKTTLQKVSYAKNQIKAGYALIFWNTELESASLISPEQAEEIQKQLAAQESYPPAD